MPAILPQQNKALLPAGPVKTPTRERILSYLQENRVASVQSLSRAWGLTRAGIRYHFNALVDDDLIELVPRDLNQPARRGRPEQQYRLAASSSPDNFPALCAALLHVLLAPLHVEDREPVLRVLAGQLASSFVRVSNPTQRLNQACAYLSLVHYRARWEAYASGPRILLRNCPYAAILPAHPELCDLDRFLLETMLQTPLMQTAQIHPFDLKPGACVFISRQEF